MNTITSLSPKQLRRAADIQERVLSLQNELNDLLGAPAPALETKARGRKRLSRQARANIRAAAKRRWAKLKALAPRFARKPKRRLSAAARARLSALAKARWQKAKAAGRGRL